MQEPRNHRRVHYTSREKGSELRESDRDEYSAAPPTYKCYRFSRSLAALRYVSLLLGIVLVVVGVWKCITKTVGTKEIWLMAIAGGADCIAFMLCNAFMPDSINDDIVNKSVPINSKVRDTLCVTSSEEDEDTKTPRSPVSNQSLISLYIHAESSPEAPSRAHCSSEGYVALHPPSEHPIQCAATPTLSDEKCIQAEGTRYQERTRNSSILRMGDLSSDDAKNATTTDEGRPIPPSYRLTKPPGSSNTRRQRREGESVGVELLDNKALPSEPCEKPVIYPYEWGAYVEEPDLVEQGFQNDSVLRHGDTDLWIPPSCTSLAKIQMHINNARNLISQQDLLDWDAMRRKSAERMPRDERMQLNMVLNASKRALERDPYQLARAKKRRQERIRRQNNGDGLSSDPSSGVKGSHSCKARRNRPQKATKRHHSGKTKPPACRRESPANP